MQESMLSVLQGDGLPEPATAKPLTIILSADGIGHVRTYPNYQIINTPKIQNGVRIVTPLPWAIYSKVVGFFKAVYQEHKTEALTYIWLHPEKGWEIQIPEQIISHGGVTPINKELKAPEDGYRLWGHIHSHCDFGPFFSGTDDAGETQEGLIYGVVGYNNRTIPESNWRVRSAGKWYTMKFEDIVQLPNATFAAPPSRWLDQVKESKKEMKRLPAYSRPVVEDKRRVGKDGEPLKKGPFVAFERIIAATGEVYLLWNDGAMTKTRIRVEDLAQKERQAARYQGVDYHGNMRDDNIDGKGKE